MDFLSLPFGALCLGSLLAFYAVPTARLREVVLGIASAVYVASFAGSPGQLGALGLFLALGYCLVLLARLKPGTIVFGAAVVLLIVCFAWLKRYTALSEIPQPPSTWVTVGLSYILFRVLMLAIDEFQGLHSFAEQKAGPLRYLLFTCSFLTFVSGPIQRHEGAALGAFSIDAQRIYLGASRMANGYLKVILVSALLLKLHGCLLAYGGVPPWATFGAASLVYLFFLYANFSGSIDIVLGLGMLFGIALPENFMEPFRAGNLLELWARWHITLSGWFKFYVFNQLLKFLGRWFKTPSSMVWAGVLGYFVTFFLMGLWHGTTFAFVLYGAVLGLGVAGTKVYEVQATKRLGKKGLAALRARPLYAAAANGFTLAYFSVALALWWKTQWNVAELAGGFLLILVAVALVRLLPRPFTLSLSKGASTPITFKHHLWLGARAWVIAAIAFDTSFHVPELIYRGF